MYAIRSYYVQEPTVKTVAETNAAENGRNNTLPSANPVSGDSAEAVPALPEKRRDVAYRVAVDEGYLLDYTASKQTMQQQAKPRITSYNVCYTKLLRTVRMWM